MSEDLIKRSDAIKAFVEETNGVNVEEAIKAVDAYLQIRECDEVWDSIRAIRDCLECAKYDIAEVIPSADRPQGWIPCSERLPSNFGKDETVLATTDVDGRRVVLMLATDVERFYLKGYVSAWMPSPKPWEGAEDGD